MLLQSAFRDGEWAVPERFNFSADVIDVLASSADRAALTFVSKEGAVASRITFRELSSAAARWTNLLRARGIRPGDRVLVLAGKISEWPAIMLGSIGLGAVTIPCSDMLRAKDLDYRIEHSGARLLVTAPSVRGEVERLANPIDTLYLDEAESLLSAQRDTTDWHDSAALDPAFILYTSGTTKHPKGVVHSHGWTFAKRMQAEHWLDFGRGAAQS